MSSLTFLELRAYWFFGRDAPDTGIGLAGYPANPKAGYRYPLWSDTWYLAGQLYFW
jgi:hypothetical protein